MVRLRRILEGEKLTTDIKSQKEMFSIIKNNLKNTDLVTLQSIGITNNEIVSTNHRVETTYINKCDVEKLKKEMEKTRKEVRDNITPLEIAKNIDHSIDEVDNYIPSKDSLFALSERGDFTFIPYKTMFEIRALIKELTDNIQGLKLRLEPKDRNNKSLRAFYRCEEAVKAVTLDIIGTYNRRKIALKDIKTMGELKQGLKESIRDPAVEQILDSFKAPVFVKDKKYARDLADNILYVSLTATTQAHCIGYIDMSFKRDRVQLSMTGYRTGMFKMDNGVLKKVL